MKYPLFLAATAAAIVAAMPASAAVITPVGVTASSTFFTYDVQNLINGSGLSAGFHDGNFNNAWQTATTGEPAFLIFDLGASYALEAARIWQYNVDFGLDRGVRDLAISISADGVAFTQAVTGSLLQANGRPTPAQLIEFDGLARYVRLDLLNNYGDRFTWTGLSEVRFDGTAAPVPEPASWAMMIGGFGLVGGALRRRHATTATRVTFA